MVPKSKSAIVTGAGGGIGAAICRRLTGDGLPVAAWDFNGQSIERLKADGAAAAAFPVDVSDPSLVELACSEPVAALGRPSMLVNCAGIREVVDPLELSPESWRRVMGVNLGGALDCTQAVARVMAAHGGGSIVNIASIASLDAYPNRTAYVASKHGLLGLTRSTALDLARHQIP